MQNAFLNHVEYIFFGMLISGIFFIIDDDIKLLISRFELRQSLKMKEMNVIRADSISRHIDVLLAILPGKRYSASDFMRISVAAATVVLILTAISAGAPACYAAALVTLFIPYIILRLKCEKIRSQVSDEREKLISIILSAYRRNNLNIEKAIEYAAAQNNDLPHTSQILSTMLLRLRECGDEKDVQNVTDGFAQAVGGGWARSIAANIRIAYVHGRDIHMTLEEQLKQVVETRQLMQERMRSNNESIRMTAFMIPATIVITTALAAGQMNMTISQIVKAQFGDSTGCMLFLVIMVLFIFNLASTQLFLKKRTEL